MASSQGKDFKSKLDESKAPPMDLEDPQKGLAVEKVSVIGKPKGDEDLSAMINKKTAGGVGPEMPEEGMDDQEMTDDELKELIQKYMS